MLSIESIIAMGTGLLAIAVFIITLRIEGHANSKKIDELQTEIRENRKESNAKFDKFDAKFEAMTKASDAKFEAMSSRIDDKLEKINDVLLQNSKDIGILLGAIRPEPVFNREKHTYARGAAREPAQASV